MRVLGYVTSRTFQGFNIPVPAQNSCLREYARSQNLIYVLPPLEHYFENCFMQLFTVINSLQKNDVIAMYSAAMLPNDLDKLESIFLELKLKECSMHFILEAKTIQNIEEAKIILYSYSLRNMFDNMYQIDLMSLRKILDKNV